MKKIRLFSALLGLAACTLCATDAKASVRTEIVFDHPENFTDVKDGDFGTEKGRDTILSNIRVFLAERSDHALPDGYSLKVTFSDIDLAGEYEPWRGSQWDNVRIIKAIYPPAFRFTYSVSDPAGRVVKQGSENIRDLDFQMRVADPTNDDPLRYEKSMLSDWVRSNLRNIK
jgi:hypothetical protein